MMTSEHRIFGCPVCGYRISQKETTCHRCGNVFSGSTKFECPFCGDLVEQGAPSCPSCHVDYAEFRASTEARGGDDSIDSLLNEIIRLEAASVKVEGKIISCPKCTWLLKGDETECPKCGMKFSEDVSFQCPICGSPVMADAPKCGECGVEFGGEEGLAEVEEGEDHEQAAITLDEIVSSVGAFPHYEPAEDERPRESSRPVKPEPEPFPEPVVEEPQPPVEPEPAVEEVAPEPVLETPPQEEPVPEALPDDFFDELESDVKKPQKAPQKKKSKQRKLKAKPQGAKKPK